MSDAEIYRDALRVIQQCGAERDPKALAFARSSLCHEHGDLEEANRWAEIANAIDDVLEGVTRPEHVPTALH